MIQIARDGFEQINLLTRPHAEVNNTDTIKVR